MTLFTKDDCKLCEQIKSQFDLEAMDVHIEVLGSTDADALAHLAWHGLVETARKTLPLLVLDDSSTVDDFTNIESYLMSRADQLGVQIRKTGAAAGCESGSCALQ